MAVKIFVSYAHADMRPRPGYKSSRMSHIIDEIKHELRCHDKRSDFSILRDIEGVLHAGDNLDEKISAAIKEADIGLILLSRSYCRSEECLAELQQLLRQNKLICLVETENAWAGEYEDTLRLEFPNISRIIRSPFWTMRDNKEVDFGWPIPHPESADADDYYQSLRFTKESLENMRHEILLNQKENVRSEISKLPEHMVFIASPTADVRREADRLSLALTENGYSVFQFDHKRHITEDVDVEEILELATNKCRVLIQLLGAVPGGRLNDGRMHSVPQQYKIMNASDKPVHVWEAPIVDRSESGDAYRTFLNSVKSHSSSYQEFERYVLKQVDRCAKELESMNRREELAEKIEDRGEILPMVGIDFAMPDADLANLVMAAVGQFANVAPLEFDLNGERLERVVSDSDGIVMVYGDSSAGKKRVSAHFGIIQRFKNRNVDALFDVAIGNGANSEGDGAMPTFPRGPNVHVISINTEDSVVDQSALSGFVENIKDNATKRYE